MNPLLSDALTDLSDSALRLEDRLANTRERLDLACDLAKQAVGVGKALVGGNQRLRAIVVEDLGLAHAAHVHASTVMTDQGQPSETAIRNHQRAATTIHILESVLRSMNEVGAEVSVEIATIEGAV